jgi:uncharacterized membrane protein
MISENKMIIWGIIFVVLGILAILYSIKNLKKINNGEVPEKDETDLDFTRNRLYSMLFMAILAIIGGLLLIFY